MGSSRTKNTTRNILGGTLNKLVTILFPFIIRTLVIKKLGIDYLGLNSLVTSILQVLNMTELGFSTAIVYSLYKPIAEKDSEKICALMALYKKAYRLIGLIVLTVGTILIPFVPFLIKGSVPSDVNIQIVYIIYLINTSVSYLLFAYKSSLLIAHQRQDITSNISTILLLVQYFGQIMVLFVFKNYYLYIIMIPFSTIINNFVIAYTVNKRYPHYISRGELDSISLRDIKKRISGLMIFRISNATRNSFDSIFISSYIGLTSVAIYNNYYYIISAIGGLLNVITVSMNASIGNSIVVESIEKNYKDFKVLNFIYMLISGWCTVMLISLYQPFMKIWVGGDYLLPTHVMILISVYFYALRMGDIRGIYNDAAGLWWEQRYRTITEAVTNIILNWILVINFGVFGVVLATLITILVFGFSLSGIITFKHYFGLDKVKEFFKYHFIYASVTFIVAIIVYRICSIFNLENKIIDFVTKGIIGTVITIVSYLIIYYKTIIFKESSDFIKTKIKVIQKKK